MDEAKKSGKLASQLLQAELIHLGIESDIDAGDDDQLVSLQLTFPSGAIVNLVPGTDYPDDDNIGDNECPVIKLSVNTEDRK